MSANIVIECGKGEAAYKIIVTGKDLKTFVRVSQLPGIKDTSGEELVQFLLTAAKGEILQVSRFKDSALHDGPGGEPAVEYFDRDGNRSWLQRYKRGQLYDGAYGESAPNPFRKKAAGP